MKLSKWLCRLSHRAPSSSLVGRWSIPVGSCPCSSPGTPGEKSQARNIPKWWFNCRKTQMPKKTSCLPDYFQSLVIDHSIDQLMVFLNMFFFSGCSLLGIVDLSILGISPHFSIQVGPEGRVGGGLQALLGAALRRPEAVRQGHRVTAQLAKLQTLRLRLALGQIHTWHKTKIGGAIFGRVRRSNEISEIKGPDNPTCEVLCRPA